jgi:hypothetical protein
MDQVRNPHLALQRTLLLRACCFPLDDYRENRMIKVRTFAPVVAASALLGLAGCSALGMGGSSQQAAATPPPAPAPAPAPAPPPAPTMSPQQAEHSHDTVSSVQTALQQDGEYHGKVDGVWGPMTRRAVMAYQRKNNMQPTGQLDGQTLQALNGGGGGMSNGGAMGTSGGGGMNNGGAMGTNGAPAGGTGTSGTSQ